MNNSSWIIVDGIYVTMSGKNAIDIYGTSHDITIRNCEASYIGGCDQYLDGIHTVRYGNGIQINIKSYNILVENNNIYEVYDAGISPQGSSPTISESNIKILNNHIWNCEYGIEFWCHDSMYVLNNIFFMDNLIETSGSGWSHNQRPSGANGRGFLYYSSNYPMTNIFIQGNQFIGATESLMRFENTDNFSGFNIDNNIYSNGSGSIIKLDTPNVSYVKNTFDNWISTYGFDTNSTVL
jgi:hypothetical protein